MKKIICIILCLVLFSSFGASASNEYEDSIARVCGIGVMGNVADGDFRSDDNITRAEFTAVALRLLGIFSAPQTETVFSDVNKEHWASGYVGIASDLKLINGRGNGTFAPEDYVTYQEAVKILVCALGREYAMTTYDYPSAYMAEAGKIGVTDGVEYTDSPLTRRQVAALADNALDVRPLEPVYGKGGYQSSEYTLFEKLSTMKDTFVSSGILTKNVHYSLDFSTDRQKGYVEIDGVAFKTDKDYDSLIGHSVDVYYTQKGNVKNAVYIASVPNSNKVIMLDAQDTRISNGKIFYIQDSDKEKSYSLSDGCAFIVNGDTLSLPLSFSIENGDYTLIDNDYDNSIDVIVVKKAESFIVKSVSKENTALYFDNNKTYHARNGFAFDFENDDKKYIITDKDGNKED